MKSVHLRLGDMTSHSVQRDRICCMIKILTYKLRAILIYMRDAYTLMSLKRIRSGQVLRLGNTGPRHP
jgi:hypothetical protein